MPQALTMGEIRATIFRMSTVKIASALLLAASAAVSLELAYRIVLPDTAGIGGTRKVAVYDSVQDKTYFGGQGAAGILAGPLGRRSSRIELPGFGHEQSQGFYQHPQTRRVYAISGYDTLVYVIDPSADTVISTMCVPQPWYYHTMADRYDACLNPVGDRLYVALAGSGGGGIGVFDIQADTSVRVVDCPPGHLCYNSVSDKYYVKSYGGGNKVHIFDASSDTLLRTVQAGSGSTDINYLRRCNKVYVCNYFGASVTVIDGALDSVMCEIPVGVGPCAPTVNEKEGKVYISTDWAVYVVDGYGDTVRAVIPANRPTASAWNPVTGKVYCDYRGGVVVVDGATDEVLRDLPCPVWASWAVCNTRRNMVHQASVLTWEMCAIDGSADTLLWYECVGRSPGHRSTVWSSRQRKLYGLNRLGMDLTVTPILRNVKSEYVILPFSKAAFDDALTMSPNQDKLYAFANNDSGKIVVVNSTTLALDSIPVHGFTVVPALVVPPFNRLYQFASDDLYIVDTNTDSVIRILACGEGEQRGVFSPTSSKVYWAHDESLMIFDASGDSLLRIAPATEYGGRHVQELFWHPANRVYAATTDSLWPLKVVDCTRDSIVARVGVTAGAAGMCYSPVRDRLYYMASTGTLFGIDCASHRIMSYRYFTTGEHLPPVYNPKSDRVYVVTATPTRSGVVRDWWVVALDCATDEIAASINIGYEPNSMVVDPDSGFVMVMCENSVLYVIRDTLPAAVEERRGISARQFSLSAVPNPSLGGVLIRASLPVRMEVDICIFDTAGRLVQNLMQGETGPGVLEFVWDGSDGVSSVPAGTYFVRLSAGGRTVTRKVTLAR